jgi:hypothetical protein
MAMMNKQIVPLAGSARFFSSEIVQRVELSALRSTEGRLPVN